MIPERTRAVSLRTLRIALATAAFLASAVALLAFLAAPRLGSAYQSLIGPLGSDLPLPTVDVALPLLRVAPGGPHGEAVTSPGAAVVWLLVVLGPWAGFAWAFRAPDVPMALARWVVALSIYVPFVTAVAAAVLLGLVLPFGCL
jgi:hypothetical protein